MVDIGPKGNYKTISEALFNSAERFTGMDVVMRLSSGEHFMGGVVLDANLMLARLDMVAESDAFISSNAFTLLEVRAGAPPVKLQGLRLNGQVRI